MHIHDYRFMTPSGEVLEAGNGVGIAEVVRLVCERSGIAFSYQVVHRALRATGLWLGSYRPNGAASRPVVLVIERASTDQPSPP